MNRLIGSSKVGKDDKIHIPKDLKSTLRINAGDVLVFMQSDCGIVVTNNEVS